MTLGGIGVAAYPGTSNQPEGTEAGKKPERSWFRPWNLVRFLATLVALDYGTSMFMDRKPVLGQMTEYQQNRFNNTAKKAPVANSL